MPAYRFGQGQQAIQIDVRRRQLALDPRLAPEAPIREASELGRSLIGSILKCELVEHRCTTIALDVAGKAPRLHDWGLRAFGSASDRPRQLHISFETRHAAIECNGNIELGGQRLIDGIKGKPKLDPIVRLDTASRNPVRKMVAGSHERALALGRTAERTQLAAKLQLIEHQLRAVCRIAQRDTAILD